jgi:hypothetical protein
MKQVERILIYRIHYYCQAEHSRKTYIKTIKELVDSEEERMRV